MIALIWAESENGIIGKDGAMLWHLPNDLKYFQSLTQNNIVIMGYNTFVSLGSKPLPNRRNVVIARPGEKLHPEVEIMQWPRQISHFGTSDDIFIIGGKKTYDLMMPYADILYRTVVHAEFEGDTFAPQFDADEWQMVHSAMGVVNAKNIYPHTFMKYRRKE